MIDESVKKDILFNVRQVELVRDLRREKKNKTNSTRQTDGRWLVLHFGSVGVGIARSQNKVNYVTNPPLARAGLAKKIRP